MQAQKEWFNGLSTNEAKEERMHIRVWVGRVLLLAVIAVLTGFATGAFAGPLFQAEAEGVKVVLTDDDCRLPAVENLKKRAFWHEKGKVYEGCFAAHPQFPIIMAYFADKTVVVLPVEMFVPVRGA